MKHEKFKVIQFIREFIIIIDKQMEDFPKKDIEIKNKIRMNSYDLLELGYKENSIENIEHKKEIIVEMIAKIKVIDFLINLAYDKKILTQKKYTKFGEKADDIVRYASGWLESLK